MYIMVKFPITMDNNRNLFFKDRFIVDFVKHLYELHIFVINHNIITND